MRLRLCKFGLCHFRYPGPLALWPESGWTTPPHMAQSEAEGASDIRGAKTPDVAQIQTTVAPDFPVQRLRI